MQWQCFHNSKELKKIKKTGTISQNYKIFKKLTNFTKFLQISPNFSKFLQISPNFTKFLQSLPKFRISLYLILRCKPAKKTPQLRQDLSRSTWFVVFGSAIDPFSENIGNLQLFAAFPFLPPFLWFCDLSRHKSLGFPYMLNPTMQWPCFKN